MMEKQNAVERKTAAGDADEIDDVIDAGAAQFEARAGVQPAMKRDRPDTGKDAR